MSGDQAQKTAKKPGGPPCGLYVVTPDDMEGPALLPALRQLFMAANSWAYEKNNHILEFRLSREGLDEDTYRDAAGAFCELARGQGFVFIMRDDALLARDIQADGVIVDTASAVPGARALLGDDAIIGVRCGSSMAAALEARNAGADYVVFHGGQGLPHPDLITGWQREKSDLPCVAAGGITNDDCAFFVQAGADYIDASAYIWNHPQGVMKGVVNMTYAIDLALEYEKKE